MTDDSGVRAVIYVLKTDLDFAVFDRDVHSMEARHLGTWDEYTPAGLVVAKDATFAPDISKGHGHVLRLPRGDDPLNACQVMAGDGVMHGVTVGPLMPR